MPAAQDLAAPLQICGCGPKLCCQVMGPLEADSDSSHRSRCALSCCHAYLRDGLRPLTQWCLSDGYAGVVAASSAACAALVTQVMIAIRQRSRSCELHACLHASTAWLNRILPIVTSCCPRVGERTCIKLARRIAFGSYNDRGPYHGWIFTYAQLTLKLGAIFCATPNGQVSARQLQSRHEHIRLRQALLVRDPAFCSPSCYVLSATL